MLGMSIMSFGRRLARVSLVIAMPAMRDMVLRMGRHGHHYHRDYCGKDSFHAPSPGPATVTICIIPACMW